MREFRCESLGYDCSWKHIARTEDLLTDMVALHLRDVHGLPALDADRIGKIKNHFTYPSREDAEAAADIIIKEYNCDIQPECTWRYVAMTEELITQGVAAHAREAHGIHTLRHEMIARIKKSIHKWTGDKGKAA